MKIAIISDYLPKYHKIWSGAEIISMTLSEMLKSKGCEVFFITAPFDFLVQDDANRVISIKTPLKKLGTVSRNFPVDIGAIANIYKTLRKEKPDIAHINAKYLFLPTMITCNLLKIPTLFTVPDYFILCPTTSLKKANGAICEKNQGAHCFECISSLTSGTHGSVADAVHGFIKKIPKSLLKIPFYIRAKEFSHYIKRVKAFIVLSASSRKRLIDYGIPEEKVHHIYHYKIGTPKESSEKIKSPSVMFAGKFCKENGTDILLDAFAETVKNVKDAKLYLIGWPEESFKKTMDNKITSYGIKNNVIVLGKRENPEILSLISKSDVVVVPHQWPKEFGPVILIEALAMGKPVITSRIGGTDEFVVDGENGFLIKDYKNAYAFAEKIIYLLSDTEKAKEMGDKGKEKVAFLFWDGSSSKMLQLYTKLIKK